MTRKIGAILTLGLICGSCTRDFLVEPSGSANAIQLAFSSPGLVWRGQVGDNNYPIVPCISELSVKEMGHDRQIGRVIWEISASGGCVKLGKVEVGNLPPGFDQTASHLPLSVGNIYRATAKSDKAVGASKPWLVCPEAPKVVSTDDFWLVNPPRRCGR
jgi:hypothetical protein